MQSERTRKTPLLHILDPLVVELPTSAMEYQHEPDISGYQNRQASLRKSIFNEDMEIRKKLSSQSHKVENQLDSKAKYPSIFMISKFLRILCGDL